MRKDVLVLEYQEVFGEVAVRIVHQDEEVLKRGEFGDKDIEVYSACNPSFGYGTLYIRGITREDDSRVFVVSKEEAEIIKERVKAINEKYGIKERWRADVRGAYFSIVRDYGKFTVEDYTEDNDYVDDNHYNSNNYFQTREQAKEALNRIKEILSQYQKELLEEE